MDKIWETAREGEDEDEFVSGNDLASNHLKHMWNLNLGLETKFVKNKKSGSQPSWAEIKNSRGKLLSFLGHISRVVPLELVHEESFEDIPMIQWSSPIQPKHPLHHSQLSEQVYDVVQVGGGCASSRIEQIFFFFWKIYFTIWTQTNHNIKSNQSRFMTIC